MLPFALNHMTTPRLGWEAFLDLSKSLGCVGVEFRNDLPGALFQGEDPARVGEAVRARGLRFLALAEVKMFNDWSDAKAAEAEALMKIAVAAGAEAVSLIPRNDGVATERGESRRVSELALREILPMQAAHHPSGRLGHLGNVSHRKRLLPIFSLAELQGLPPTTFDHRAAVVVTRVDGDDIGLAVEALIAVEHVGSYGGKTGPSRNFVYRKMAADQGLLRLLRIEELPLGL